MTPNVKVDLTCQTCGKVHTVEAENWMQACDRVPRVGWDLWLAVVRCPSCFALQRAKAVADAAVQ